MSMNKPPDDTVGSLVNGLQWLVIFRKSGPIENPNAY
jgi:hypothetical protein